MLAEKVEEFASERRIREYLTQALTDPSSAVIQGVVQAVRKHLPKVKVDASAVMEALAKPATTNTLAPLIEAIILPSIQSESVLFTFEHKGVKATGRFDGKGIVIQSGSQVAMIPQPSSAEAHAKAIQKAALCESDRRGSQSF